MKVHLRKKKIAAGHTLVLDYYHEGKRTREYLKIHLTPGESHKDKKILAETIRAQRELELNSNEYNFIPAHVKKIDFFYYFQSQIDKSTRKDIRVFNATLSKLKDFYKKDVLPSNLINEAFCRDFRRYLSKHLSGETPFDYFKIFVHVIKTANRDKIISGLPHEGVPNPKPSTRILGKDILTDSELKELILARCPNEEVRRAFLFSCFTGLRLVDIRALKWKNIDLKNMSFRFRQSKTENLVMPPLNKSAIRLLGKGGKDDDFIFDLISHTGINKDLKAWVANTDIKKHITFHCARHSFATSLLVHGADLKTTSELLGHTTTRQTERYTHISERMKRKAVDLLPELV